MGTFRVLREILAFTPSWRANPRRKILQGVPACHGFGFVGLACSLFILSAGPAQAQSPRRVDSLHDGFAEVEKRVPGFGGMFIGADGMLRVYLVDMTQSANVETEISDVFGRDRLPVGTVHVLQGTYSFVQLKQWHDRHRLTTLGIPGVVSTGINERTNRLKIGVLDKSVFPAVERSLSNLGIPRQAVTIVEVEPTLPYASLQQLSRPLQGGLQVSGPGGTCTLGFLAVRAGVAGFVTASHCTIVQGGTEGTVFHQPFISGTVNQIGIESVDPPYSGGSRVSDSAFVQRNAGPNPLTPRPSADFGYIAMPDYNSLQIVSQFRIAKKVLFPISGESLAKVGRTTGLTEGIVSETCVDTTQTTGFAILCQDRVDAPSAPGDSGSPVFWSSGATLLAGGLPSAHLHGVLWGGNKSGTDFVFSNMANVQKDLGPLKTYPEDGGVNSPPEVKITAPTTGTTVGIGGFNVVKFKADVVDYEGCCTATWSSDKDGIMELLPGDEFTFPSSGSRTITLTVTDSGGLSASDSVTLSVGNVAPQVWIKKPGVSQKIYKGFPVVFQAVSYDPNEPFFSLPCSSLRWDSSGSSDTGPGGFPKTGCAPQVTFTSAGSREITLTGTDSEGLKASAQTILNVVEASPNSPPIVGILNPTSGVVVDTYGLVTLRGIVTDPDQKNPISYEWMLMDKGIKSLGVGTSSSGADFTMQWKPAQTVVPQNCGGRTVHVLLFAKDADGNAGWPGIVELYVPYPVC